MIWRCLFYLGKSFTRGRQIQLLRHHVTSKLLCYCEKNFPSHARKFKTVRRILFICTNCAVFVLFSFLLVTSFEQDSEPAIVAEKMTRLLSEAEPPMRTTQDQEVGLLFLSSFFSLLLHRTSCSVYVNRVRNTYEKSVQRAQRKCKICHEAQMMMMMMIIIMTIIIIIIIYYCYYYYHYFLL